MTDREKRKSPSGANLRVVKPSEFPGRPPSRPPTMADLPAPAEDTLFTSRTFAAGTTILESFESLVACYVILRGKAVLKTYASSGETDVEMRRLEAGDLVGLEFLGDLGGGGCESSFTVVAETDVVAYEIDAEQLECRDQHLRQARNRFFLQRVGQYAHRLAQLFPDLLAERVRADDLQTTLDAVEDERRGLSDKLATARTEIERLDAYCRRFTESEAAKALLAFREAKAKQDEHTRLIERQLLERTGEVQSALSLLSVNRELLDEFEDELDERKRETRALIQALVELAPQFHELQESPDPRAQTLGLYCLGILHGLKMRP